MKIFLFLLIIHLGQHAFSKNKASAYTPEVPKPTHSEVSYGTHDRNVLDFWKAKSENVYSRLIDTAMEVNRNITDFVVNKTSKMLNKRGKSISAANILILGVSYKSNIDDIRESPALDIIEKLLDLKATISYDDKFVLKTSMKGKLRKIKKVINVTNSEKTIAKYDAILLLTNHDYYDYENIKKYADLVIDTRGVFINNKSNIERG